MFRALDAEGNNILASQAISSETYFCPCCHQELYQRRGTIRIPHFAHKPNVSDRDINRCSDGWGHDTSAWHIDWQLRFPEEFYEKRLEHNGIWHVADIATNRNIIIEFQHSPISIEEFRERNAFYTTCGYRVIWVFDLVKECDMQRLENSLENNEGNEFHWSHVKKPFQDIKVKEECAVIYIQ